MAVVCQGPDGIKRDLLPMPWNARTRVHEYGGRSYLPLPDGFVFANFADQRLYRCGTTGSRAREPGAADPGPGADVADRFADLSFPRRGTRCGACGNGTVRHEPDHPGDRGRPAGRLGRGRPPDAIRVLVSGSDFYAYPAPSPDGTRLAWICWDHPRMPWDGTELRVAALTAPGRPARASSRCSWAARPSRCSPRSGGTTGACT